MKQDTLVVLARLLFLTKCERTERVYKEMFFAEIEKRSRGGNHRSA